MRKLLLRMALTLPIALISQASAMPAANPFLRDAAVSVDLIEVKGGHGSWLGSRARWLSSVWLEPRAQGRLARPWVPARPLEEGLVLSRGGVFSIAQPEIQISLVRPRQTRLRSIKPSAAICCKLCLMLVGDHMRFSPPALLGRADQVIEFE